MGHHGVDSDLSKLLWPETEQQRPDELLTVKIHFKTKITIA